MRVAQEEHRLPAGISAAAKAFSYESRTDTFSLPCWADRDGRQLGSPDAWIAVDRGWRKEDVSNNLARDDCDERELRISHLAKFINDPCLKVGLEGRRLDLVDSLCVTFHFLADLNQRLYSF